MRDYDENKESSYLKYWGLINIYRWAMSQKWPVNGFEWVGNASQFYEDFIKSYNEENVERYFLNLMLNILKSYINFTMIYSFYRKE